MTTTGSRYPLMFNPTRLNKGQAKAKTQQKTPGLTNKSKDLKYYDGQSHGETTKKLETRVVKKSTGGSTNKATGNRSQPAPKSSQVGYNSQNVNFRGGRPFGPNNRPAVEVKKENKTQDSQGYKSNTGGTVRQNNKKVLLKQSNDRVKLVKEIIKEEAVPLLSSVQESPRVGEVNVNQHGSVGYKATVVPDERGPLTINLYLQPDNQTSETTIDTGTQSDKRLIGRDKVEGPQRETDSTNKAHTLIPNVSKSNPTHGGSMDPAKKPNISEGNYTSVEDGSPHVKQAPLEQKPVDTRAVFDSPHTQSPGHFAHPKINSQRPTISIDDANKHLLQLENADPHRKNSQLQMPHASETLNVRRNHLTSSSPARKLSKGKQVHYYNNGVQDLKPGVSDDSSNEEYDYFSDTDFKSRPEIVFTPIDELLNPVTGNGLGDQRPQSENMDNRQHDLKSYPRPVDSRERFEQRLDHEILKDMRHQQAALYPVRDQYAHGMGRKTPDHLKDLSVKHYLESRSRLTSGEASPLHSPTRSPQHHVHSRGHHRESVGVRNAHTNTGTIQYVLRNKNNKQDSSTSSVSTIAMDSQTPTLPHIYGHMPPIPQPRKKTTRRVKDSEAQTDYNSDLSDAESDTVSTQEIAIQTQKVPKQDQPVTMTQESTKEATQSGIEIGIQTNDVPKDAFTQTYEEPKTVSTSTDDLLPSVPTTPKGGTIESAAKSPVLPLYRSETMYKHIRDIIQAEDDPETSPTKTDSGYLDGGDGDDDIIAGLMTEMENEVYVLYMRTDDGAVVGPLMLEVDDVQIGLPKPVEKSVVFSDEIDTSRYSPAPDSAEGLRNRATGSNSVNEHSSRSHSMLTVNVDSEMQDPDDDSVYITKHGKLTFVDLAGSEKTKTDMVTSQEHLVESNNINRSLLVLGNCISSLGDPKKRNGHIPYRDSKLTKLLADSLGGNGVTLMIACVSPSGVNSGETMNTLRYANRAKKIKSKPVVKMDPRERLIVSLKREIKILRQENHYLRQQLDFPVKPRGQLQKENDQKFLQMLKGGKKDGKISDSGLYEMLQEYMIENELIRSENSDLHQMRDTGRREQQTLSRENERLLRKLEQLEKERMLMNTPMSVYSVGSTISRRSSGVESEAGNPPPPNYMGKDTPRANKKTHLQHPARPPHRLSEPVNKNNPGTIESQRPNNGYAARYTNQQDQLRSNPPPRGVGTGPAPQDPVPHHGASYPEVVPSPNNPVNTRTGGTGVSKAKPKPAFSQEAPVAQPRKSKGAFQPPNSQGIPTSHSNLTATEEEDDLDTESIAAMNDRLRQELLDLEGQIKKQTRLATRTDAQPSSSIPDGYSRR